MEPTWEEIEAAFQHAADLEGEARQSYLDALAERDPSLAEQVEDLLKADQVDDSLLRQPVLQSAQELAELNDDRWTGRQIGAYRIVERIASGGMGAVFLAQRIDDTYQQQVAVKIMGSHLLHSDAVSRFRAERQILANLQHPNIAALLDGGTTEEGLPYLVMEHIVGEPVDDYVETHQLNLNARLRLFMQICDAVDYAHRSLVVHRDLKPNNILIDGEGNAKLLDFGIAKLIDPAQASDITQAGARAMTLDFASPEQVRGDAISVSSDVYALGVLLYYLMTGKSPYEVDSSNLLALQTSILEHEPRRPSTVVTTTLPTSQETRPFNLNPQRVSKELSGDLDNIVLMAIRKSEQQRYASVRELRDDINRYLTHRPVVARKTNALYRAKKFLQRNALAASITGISLITLLGVSSAFTLRLAAERDVATRERSIAVQVSDFVVDVFKTADPYQNKGESLTVRAALDSGVEQLENDLTTAPIIKGRIQRAIADVYYGLGDYEKTRELAEQSIALGLTSSSTDPLEQLDTQELLGDALVYLTEYEKALETLTSVYEARHQQLGLQHKDTINVLASLADLYVRMGKPERALEISEPVLPEARALEAIKEKTSLMVSLANVYQENGRTDDSISMYEEAVALQQQAWGEEDPTYLTTLSAMAIALPNRPEDLSRAITMWTDVLQTHRRILGNDHPQIAESLSNRAMGYMIHNQLDEAEADILEAIKIIRNSGADTQTLGYALTNAAKIKNSQYQHTQAIEYLNEAVKLMKTNSVGTNVFLGTAYGELATAHSNLQTHDKADHYIQLNLEEYEKGYHADHPQVISILRKQLMTLMQRNKLDSAASIAADMVERSKRSGDDEAFYSSHVQAIGVYNKLKRYQDAQTLIDTISDSAPGFFGEKSVEHGVLLGHTADTAIGFKQYEKSIELRTRAISLLTENLGPKHPFLGVQYVSMSQSLSALGKTDAARNAAETGLELLVTVMGEHHPAVQRTREILAALEE